MTEDFCCCPGCGECSAHRNEPKLKAELKKAREATASLLTERKVLIDQRDAAQGILNAQHALTEEAVAERDALRTQLDELRVQHLKSIDAATDERELIRRTFLAHGFTIKPGNDDLNPYVYEAAEALLAARAQLAAPPTASEVPPLDREWIARTLVDAKDDMQQMNAKARPKWFLDGIYARIDRAITMLSDSAPASQAPKGGEAVAPEEITEAWGQTDFDDYAPGSDIFHAGARWMEDRLAAPAAEAQDDPAEEELNCAEEVLESIAARIGLDNCDWKCVGEAVTAVFDHAMRRPTAGWLAKVAMDGDRTDAERRAAEVLAPIAQEEAEAGRDALDAAARDVLAERRRQIEAEGWTPEHDDEHREGELAFAAAGYAVTASDHVQAVVHEMDAPGEPTLNDDVARPSHAPWPHGWDFKPAPVRRLLVKSGALILAEIERLDRAALAGNPGAQGEQP